MDSLKLYVDNSSTTLSGRLPSDIYKDFKKTLGYELENAMFVQQYNPYSDGWKTTVCYSKDHCKCAIKKDGTHFPSGLISNACQFFKERDIAYEIVDIRKDFPTREINLGLSIDVIPYDYQKKVIEDAVDRQRGIIKLATGGGKTIIGAGIIAALGVSPTIFYVTSVDLLQQAKAEIERFVRKSGKTITVGAIGGGFKTIGDITVMTVQTAVRAVGAKFQKFDDEDEDDSTNIEDIKKDIAELIRNAKLYLSDECQHWKAETCQVIADNSFSARFRYGLSATPWRDAGDDILIDGCFGRPICDINASYLIKRGFLVKPHIAFVPITNLKGQKFGSYPSTYKEGLVQNEYRNQWIAGLSAKLKGAGRTTLILVNQILHGEAIQEMIPGSVFLHGSSGKANRNAHIELMRAGQAPITIASSLPYEELLLVKFEGQIRQMEIGDLCQNYSEYIKYNLVETLCSKDGKRLSWSKITDTHIHPNTHNLVRVRTDKGEETLVTSNHSLVDADLNMVKPKVGLAACSPQGFADKQEGITNEIDVVKLLKNEKTIEVEITGLTQPIIRKLKTESKWYKNPKSVNKSSRTAVKQRTKDMGGNYFLALDEIFSNFKYHKGKYRASVLKASNCKYISEYFKTKVYCRRSRSLYSLPWKLTLTNDLSIVMGLLTAEGHIAEQTCGTCKSKFDVIFAGKKNTTDGKYDIDKQNIRQIFIDSVKKSLNWEPSSINDKQIDISGKLSYLFFKNIGVINNRKEKRVPDCIFSATDDNKESFLWGHYLGDGSLKFHKKKIASIKWHTTSRPLYVGIWCLLQMLGHKIRIDISARKPNKDMYTILSRNKIKHIHPAVKVNGRKYSNSRRVQKTVDLLKRTDKTVYDISVEGCHNFIGGTLLDHNTIFDEGIDVRPLDSLILAGGGKSATRALQRIGRVIRNYTYPDGKKKTNALVYDLIDHLKYLWQHGGERRRIYQTEDEFDITTLDV